MRCRKP